MWKMISYEACGRGHKKENIPCQDKTFIFKEGNIFSIALADGAGSCKYSHYGAKLVTEYLTKFISRNFNVLIDWEDGNEIKQLIDSNLTEKLKEESIKLNCKIKDLSSTLLLVCAKGDEALIVHVGDGVIGALKKNKLEILSKPVNGEFSNSTVFVTSNNANKMMKLYRGNIKDIKAFILMSDGTCESLYNKKENYLSIGIKNIVDTLAVLDEKLILEKLKISFEQLILEKTLDDCSITVMVKKEYGREIYFKMKNEEKSVFFKLKSKEGYFNNKSIYNYEKILKTLSESPLEIKDIKNKLSIKNKRLRKQIKKLEKLGIITNKNKKFYSNLNL